MTKVTQDIKAILDASHEQPFSFLGLRQSIADDFLTITCFLPKARKVELIDKSTGKIITQLNQVNPLGLFTKKLRRKKLFDYQFKVSTTDLVSPSIILDDAYAFAATLSQNDLKLLQAGSHLKPYEILGAHCVIHQKVAGVSFSLWAPNAKSVSVVGDFNDWDGRCHLMRNLDYQGKSSGYWNIFIPAITSGCLYKFELKDAHGKPLPIKADPYGIQAQYRPETASIINAEKSYAWQDSVWMAERAQRNDRSAPISIYEVHLGSWKRGPDNEYLNYRALADQLIPYTKKMGFTHLQLMPISEYPFDGSWGYQPVGLFAPTARFGTAEDFKYFVDQCHLANIGLLIDWVPGHFPSDDHGLAQFDGSHLYEHADPRQGFHPDWNTLIYNYGRVEVANFLRASALHWCDKFHIDGIRVDAVASMLYLDYSRKDGEWLPNILGGNENLEAVAFIQRFNEELYQQYPGTFSVAEESTSWPGVSRPTDQGGLGFGYKWNMGWMNDSLQYIKRDPIHRQHHHNELSFGLVYAFDENFVLPISHDEVVHGKGSMIEKMPGDAWQQFANLRAYYGFMWAHPGKKLLFMGCEFAQGREWNHDKGLDWHQLDIHWHSGVQRLIKDLNQVYKSTPALYQQDCHREGFEWLDHQNEEHSIYSFIRYAKNKNEQPVVVICNFTPKTHHNFKLGVPLAGQYQELINSDNAIYGGSNQASCLTGKTNNKTTSKLGQWQGQAHFITLTVPPLSTVILSLSEDDT